MLRHAHGSGWTLPVCSDPVQRDAVTCRKFVYVRSHKVAQIAPEHPFCPLTEPESGLLKLSITRKVEPVYSIKFD